MDGYAKFKIHISVGNSEIYHEMGVDLTTVDAVTEQVKQSLLMDSIKMLVEDVFADQLSRILRQLHSRGVIDLFAAAEKAYGTLWFNERIVRGDETLTALDRIVKEETNRLLQRQHAVHQPLWTALKEGKPLPHPYDQFKE